MCGWFGVQSLPVDTFGEPFPLFGSHLKYAVIAVRTNERTLMQTALTQPNTVAVPADEFHAITGFVGENVGSAITRCATQVRLHNGR